MKKGIRKKSWSNYSRASNEAKNSESPQTHDLDDTVKNEDLRNCNWKAT